MMSAQDSDTAKFLGQRSWTYQNLVDSVKKALGASEGKNTHLIAEGYTKSMYVEWSSPGQRPVAVQVFQDDDSSHVVWIKIALKLDLVN